jgi:hypothetical protein
VVDPPLDYNLLLGISWFYAMNVVSYSVFHILRFPHQGKIINVDQLEYTTPDRHNTTMNNLPFLRVGGCLLKDYVPIMVIFFPSPTTPRVTTLNMISTQVR